MKKRNTCPVCGFDMRPKITLSKIEKPMDKLNLLKRKCEQENIKKTSIFAI